MKYLPLLIFILILSACKESSQPIVPPPIVKQRLFDVSVGSKWTLKNGSQEAFFRVLSEDTARWVLQYWDTAKQVKMQSYCIEWKEFDNGFPRYFDFAMAETDSGYFFGTRNHFLVEPNYPTDFFVKLFFIPDSIAVGRIEYDEFRKTVLGSERYWTCETKWMEKQYNFPNDTTRQAWQADYYAEQKTPVVSKIGESFTFIKGIGLYKYKNYILDSFTK